MKYAIGLDLGIASCGWAVVDLNDDNVPYKINEIGSHIYKIAEHPKDGSSLALPRRTARGARRRTRRRAHRIDRIKKLLVREGVLTESSMETLFSGKLTDIYKLRAAGLDRKLEGEELARILLNLAKRRGFRSNRKKDKEDKETGQVLSAIAENATLMQANGYRTVGEMFHKDDRFAEHKRNKEGTYLATIQRDMIEDEVRAIFEAQRGLGNESASKELEEKYIEILTSQRSFEKGPGYGPYAGDQIWKMVGECTFEKGIKRAPKASYSFERFNLLQKVNHIRLTVDGKTMPLNNSQRNAVVELAHRSPSVTFASIRKELELSPDILFNINYGDNLADVEQKEKKEKFTYLKSYHEMRKALDKLSKGYINRVSTEKRNAIALAFTIHRTDEKIANELKEHGLTDEEVTVLIDNMPSFSKFGHLSTIACDKICVWLEHGLTYDKACSEAGYDFKGHDGQDKQSLISLKHLQEAAENITSPVVKRSISRAAKVINAIIRKMGSSPSYINIELARELSKTKQKRNEIEKGMKDNQARNDRMMERIKSEFGKINPTGMDLVKLKLYEEQAGICPYSVKPIQIERLFEGGYVDVDHIIPYSISFDDRYTNKVLVFSEENRQKGNYLPLEYLKGERRERFEVWVRGNSELRAEKKRNLLKEGITEEDLSNFTKRNLTDTSTITSFLYNYLKDNLKFDESYPKKNQVTPVNGAITGLLRKRWAIRKIREDGDLHHGVDAVVVAVTTPALIKSVTQYSKYKEVRYVTGEDGSYVVSKSTGEVLHHFPEPWRGFRKELEARCSNDPARILRDLRLPNYTEIELENVKPIFVARNPRRKATGPAHKETIKSPKALDEGVLVKKVALTELKIDKKTGEIENYFMPQSDKLLYEALKHRLVQFGGDAAKAFETPFHKPKSNGEQGPVVHKVKLVEKSTMSVPVHGGNGAADNGGMVRVDVFFVEKDGYYLVPIYQSDTVKDKLPNKAIVQGKPYSEWKEVSDNDFVFSLYPDDLFYAEKKKDFEMTVKNKNSSLPKTISMKSGYFYYVSTGIAVASISVDNHDSSYSIPSMGVKSLLKFEKCYVDVLGNISKAGKEKRQTFSQKR